MDENEHVYPSGQPYSGKNKVPNIKQFVQSLDRQKAQRDATINHDPAKFQSGPSGGARDHIPVEKPGKNRRTVHDPITGRDVEIEDIDPSHMKTSKDPLVCRTPSSL